MYADGVEHDWRDVGAKDKAANIVRLCVDVLRPGRTLVVEIGCGEGAIAEALHDMNFFAEYRGYDLSQSGIEEARLRGVPGTAFAVVDGDSIPEAEGSADLVILSHVVEHLEHPRTLLYEARRIGNHVLIEVPLELNWRTPRDYVWDDLGHINKYTSTSIRHLVQTCGYKVLKQITTNPSQDVALFRGASLRGRVKWRIKNAFLSYAPVLARSLFTYHETILATAADQDDITEHG
jgi:hypothetical protein